jgi:2-iminobutanoate/2-iminopropanoate deaminase
VNFFQLNKETRMRRSTFARGIVIAAIASTLILVSCSGSNDAGVRRAVNMPDGTVSPNFSEGIVAGNTLYISGQQGTDANGKLLDGTGAQTTAALNDIRTILGAAGFQLSDVVSVNVYLADIQDFGEMNKAYVSVLPDPKPARTTIQAAALVNGARVEISAIAVKH